MKKENIINKKGFIIDMDGVLYHGNNLLPGALKFVNWLKENNKNFWSKAFKLSFSYSDL